MATDNFEEVWSKLNCIFLRAISNHFVLPCHPTPIIIHISLYLSVPVSSNLIIRIVASLNIDFVFVVFLWKLRKKVQKALY